MTEPSLTIMTAGRAAELPARKQSQDQKGQAPATATEAPESAPGGRELPAEGKPAPAPLDLGQAVEQINRYLADTRRSLVFEFDDTSGRTIIRVVNPETSEVVREIPPAEFSALARALQQGELRLLDEFA